MTSGQFSITVIGGGEDKAVLEKFPVAVFFSFCVAKFYPLKHPLQFILYTIKL